MLQLRCSPRTGQLRLRHTDDLCSQRTGSHPGPQHAVPGDLAAQARSQADHPPSNDGKAYLKSATFECDATNIGITVPFGKTVKYGATTLEYDYQLTGGSLFSQTVANIIITDGAEFRPVAAIVDSLDSYGSHIDEQVVVITPKDLATGQLRMESDDFGPYGSYISDVTFCVPAL